MYPGFTTRLSYNTQASATTIQGNADLIKLTGTTAVATIVPKLPSPTVQAQLLFLLPLDGTVASTTAGNIAVVQSLIINKVAVLVYDPVTAKWYPHALA
jgi:hypothetical protein